MFWNFLILILGIFSAIFAFPYGNWEYFQNNKSGGIIVYIIATTEIIIVFAQFYAQNN